MDQAVDNYCMYPLIILIKQVVNFVLKNNQLPVVTMSTKTSCSACCLGKIHKLPFSRSTTVYDKPLQLIVSDLWGPTPVH